MIVLLLIWGSPAPPGFSCGVRSPTVREGWSASVALADAWASDTESNLDHDVLPIKQPKQEQPQQNKYNRKRQRSIIRRQPRREPVIIDDGLQRLRGAVAFPKLD